jgi:hypothetical protein
MKKTPSCLFFVVKAGIMLIVLLALNENAFGQKSDTTASPRKPTTHPSKQRKPQTNKPANKQQKQSYTVAIDGTSSINAWSYISTCDSLYCYAALPLKFIISGKSDKNIILKLTLSSFTSAKPHFYNGATISDTYPITIPKNEFNGNRKISFKAVLIRINNKIPDERDAYIKIDKQDDAADIFFAPEQYSSKANKDTTKKGPIEKKQSKNQSKANPLPVSSILPAKYDQDVKPTIIFLASDTTLQLDSLVPGHMQAAKIKVNFRLIKGTGIDSTIKFSMQPVSGMQNVKLLSIDRDSVFFVKIKASDWNANKDKDTTEILPVRIQQLIPLTTPQSFLFYQKDLHNSFNVELVTYKAKPKPGLSLVAYGNASVASIGKLGITRSISSFNNTSIDTLTIRVRLHGKYDPNHNQLSFAFLDTAKNKYFKIMGNPDTILANKWAEAADRAVFIGKLSKKDSASLKRIKELKNQLNQTLKNLKLNNINKKYIADTTSLHQANIDTMHKVDTLNLALSNENQWEADHIKKDTTINVLLNIKSLRINDTLNNIQSLDIILQGQPHIEKGSQQRVDISIKDKPFWAELGTNFDLLDNIKTNNFYAGIYMFDKDIARILGTRGVDNLSLTGGVYESQSLSSHSTSSSGLAYRDLKLVHRDTGIVTSSTSVKSIGIFASPHWKLTSGKTDANGFHVFFSFYSEILWQTISTTFKYPPSTAGDTIPAKNLPQNMTLASYPYKQNSLSFDFRSHYQGFGFPIYLKETAFNLYINDVFGLTSQRFYINNGNADQPNQNNLLDPLTYNYIKELTFLSPRHPWNGFFLFQFRLNEVTYGLTFSGEIREVLLQNAKPVITLALSKKFDLDQVLKPVVGKF